MKHPNKSSEAFVFNLGQAPELRCGGGDGGGPAGCGGCEACRLLGRVGSVRAWFGRAGDQSRRRFLLGLVRRLHSVDLLEYFARLLSPLLHSKDYTYARMRTNPSLATDRATVSADRALDAGELDKEISKTWYWFQSANYWTKLNFVLTLLKECESHLLHLVGVQSKTLLAAEKKAYVSEDDYEAASIPESYYSHDSDARPELELLRASSRCYSVIDADPFCRASSSPDEEQCASASATSGANSTGDVAQPLDEGERGSCGDVSGEGGGGEGGRGGSREGSRESGGGFSEEGTSTASDSLDPTCSISPLSAQAHAGVSRYKDPVRWLPVHLAKYVLGMLDRSSLRSCVSVSKHWRALVEEVHSEHLVQRHLWDAVMLMQGSAAHGCNPVYAKDIDVAVPNLEQNSFRAIRTDGEVIQTTFKSEVSLTTAYSGYSTRNVIMEERNVYCGAYNVMVLVDGADPSRVFSTDGDKLIALGFHDRKVRFVDIETGKERPPVIWGHAGSVRCVAVNRGRGYVLSGSYDTSIRCWSIETGKCKKIYRGHTDTVLCLEICGEHCVSGAKDNLCKVWKVTTGKCLHTFKHRHPVRAVTMSEDMCISGCEAGQVKVWDLNTGTLIKKLTGHHSPITSIKFDRWHIITASKDGYALAWSSQGDHQRCLSALRHPKEVLCLEFMFLRVMTGCEDGKVRIWNMLTGACLRIMRGNSRSDPITSLIAIQNRVFLNTPNNLLVFNFETIEYDYTLETDKMPPLVQFSKYSDAPIRQHSYTYIRAKRMAMAGATNTKIINHEGNQREMICHRQGSQVIQQVAHSAKMLSKKRMEHAKSIQNAALRTGTSSAHQNEDRCSSRQKPEKAEDWHSMSCMKSTGATANSSKSVSMSAQTRPRTSRSHATSMKSGTQTMFSVGELQVGLEGDDDSDVIMGEEYERQRRVSWAFQHPAIPKAKELNLVETKSLLRSQIRCKEEAIPPDFIYLSVNAIQAQMRASEVMKDMESSRREQELQQPKRFGRPSSSPSRIDSRTRLPIEELDIEDFAMYGREGIDQTGPSDVQSVAESKVSRFTQSSKRTRQNEVSEPVVQTKVVYTRDLKATPLQPADKNFVSIHSRKLKSSIPKGEVLRPHTAFAIPTHGIVPDTLVPSPPPVRAKSAAAYGCSSRPYTAKTGISCASSGLTTTIPTRRKKYHGFSTSATELVVVPMLMYPPDLKAQVDQLKVQHQQQRLGQVSRDSSTEGSQPVLGAVSEFTNPFRAQSDMALRTHQQATQELADVMRNHEARQKKDQADRDRNQRQLWLDKVKSQLKSDKETARLKSAKKW